MKSNKFKLIDLIINAIELLDEQHSRTLNDYLHGNIEDESELSNAITELYDFLKKDLKVLPDSYSIANLKIDLKLGGAWKEEDSTIQEEDTDIVFQLFEDDKIPELTFSANSNALAAASEENNKKHRFKTKDEKVKLHVRETMEGVIFYFSTSEDLKEAFVILSYRNNEGGKPEIVETKEALKKSGPERMEARIIVKNKITINFKSCYIVSNKKISCFDKV